MSQRIDLDHQAGGYPVDLAKFDDAVEDGLPIPVTGKIVVGQEVFADAFLPVEAQHRLDVVGRARTRLAALDVDNRAKRAMVRAAPAGVETAVRPRGPAHVSQRQKRTRLALEVHEIVGEIVLFGQPARGGVLDKLSEPSLGLAAEQADAHRSRQVKIHCVAIEHRQAARNMKPADRNRHALRAERPRQVQRPRILIGLHAHQRNHAAAGDLDPGEQLRDVHSRIGLVDRLDFDRNLRPEHGVLRARRYDAMESRQRIGRNQASPPADHITIIVIVRRFDEHYRKALQPHPLRSPEQRPAAAGRGEAGSLFAKAA